MLVLEKDMDAGPSAVNHYKVWLEISGGEGFCWGAGNHEISATMRSQLLLHRKIGQCVGTIKYKISTRGIAYLHCHVSFCASIFKYSRNLLSPYAPTSATAIIRCGGG